jgi:hypothetical protein
MSSEDAIGPAATDPIGTPTATETVDSKYGSRVKADETLSRVIAIREELDLIGYETLIAIGLEDCRAMVGALESDLGQATALVPRFSLDEVLELSLPVFVEPNGEICDRCGALPMTVRRRWARLCDDCHAYLKRTDGGYLALGRRHIREREWRRAAQESYEWAGGPERTPELEAALAEVRGGR